MSINKQPYNAAKINHIRQLLLNNAQAGKPVDYEIRVDELKVLPRTNDPEQFDEHEEFVTEDTASVLIILYDGTSRRSTRHLFILKETAEDAKPAEQGLSGVEVDRIISDKIQQEKKQWDYEQLEKDNAQLRKQLEDAEAYAEKLEDQLQESRSKRRLGDMQWGEIASYAAESLIRRNTHLLAKVPGGEGLAGVIQEDNKRQDALESETTSQSEEGKVTYKRKSAPAELSEEDLQMLQFLKQLEERFDQEEMQQVMALLNILANDPALILPVLELAAETKIHTSTNKHNYGTNKNTAVRSKAAIDRRLF